MERTRGFSPERGSRKDRPCTLKSRRRQYARDLVLMEINRNVPWIGYFRFGAILTIIDACGRAILPSPSLLPFRHNRCFHGVDAFY